MAESTNILQQTLATEKILSLLESGKEVPELNFRWEDSEHSLLYSPDFERFVEQLRQTIIEFESSEPTQNLVVIGLDLLKIPKEEVPKQLFRRFFNALVRKFDKDGLSQYYPYFARQEFPRFRETDVAEITKDDQKTIDFWKQFVIPDLKNLSKSITPKQADETEEKITEASSKAEESPEKAGESSGSTSRRRRRYRGEERVREDLGDGTYRETTTLPLIDGQRLFLQEVVRESTIIEFQLLKAYAPELGLEHLPPDIAEYIRSQVSYELQTNLDEYFQNGKITALGRGKLVRSVLSDLQRNPFFQVQLFQTFAQLAQQQQVSTDYKNAQITPDQIEQIGRQTDVDEKDELNEKTYSALAKAEFKNELKHILALSTLQEGSSIESIADGILDYYPSIRSLEDLRNIDIRGFMPSTRFSVNQEEQELILREVNKLIQTRFAQRELKPFSSAEKQEFKQAFEKALLVGAGESEEKIDQVLDQVFSRFQQTETLAQINEETLSQALPADFLKLNAADQEKVREQILAFFKTGKLQTINPANFDSLRNAAWLRGQNPQDAMRAILTAYGIDGKDVSATQILQLLDGYALNEACASEINQNIGALLNEVNPRLLQNPELTNFLVLYVEDRKHQIALYTQNQVATYSDEELSLQEITANVVHTNTLIRQYGTDVVAHAYFTRNLADLDVVQDEQERVKRDKAWKLRQYLVEMQKEEFKKLTQTEKENYAASLGIDRATFTSANAQFDEAAYENAIINASNLWGAPEVDESGNPLTPQQLGGWVNSARGLRNVKNQGLKNVAQKLATSQLGKGVAVGAGGLGAGALIYGAITNAVQGIAGTTLGGAVGGGVAGAAIGSVIPVIGTGVGALTGAIVGGIGGFIAGINGGGTQAASNISGAVAPGLKSFSQEALKSGASGGTQIADISMQTLTTSAVPGVAPAALVTAVVGTPIFLIITSILAINIIFTAFLPDASTTQVAPFFSLDVEESRYVTLRKVAQPANAPAPGIIKYTIDLQKKADATETIIITGFTDTMSAIDVNSTPIDPPQLPQSVIDQLKTFEGKELTVDQPIHIEFEVDVSSGVYQDSLVKNDIGVKFTANNQPDESRNRAQTCFGDCPKTVLPACWPVTGTVWQPPCATGTRSNPKYNPLATYSHHRGAVCLDSYDIGGTIGTPVYAMAPGTVISAQIDPRTAVTPGTGYGNLIQIDHGGFVTFYAHQNRYLVKAGDTVEGGQQIGEIGMNGFSSGPHLHFEVTGLQEFIFQDLFGISGKSVPTNGPRCDEYYGKS